MQQEVQALSTRYCAGNDLIVEAGAKITLGERVEELQTPFFTNHQIASSSSVEDDAEDEWKLEHDYDMSTSSCMDDYWEATRYKESQSFEELQLNHKHLSLLPQHNGSILVVRLSSLYNRSSDDPIERCS